MSSGRSVPGLYELVGVGALPTLDTGGVLDLDLPSFICGRGAYERLEFTVDDPETFDQAVNLPEVFCRKVRGVSRKLPFDPRQLVYQVKEPAP